jgi:hypothetical protein
MAAEDLAEFEDTCVQWDAYTPTEMYLQDDRLWRIDIYLMRDVTCPDERSVRGSVLPGERTTGAS